MTRNLKRLPQVGSAEAEAKALEGLAKAREVLDSFEHLDVEGSKRRLKAALGIHEMMDDSEALRRAIPAKAARESFARDWRKLADWLETHANRLVTIATFYETSQVNLEEPSGVSFGLADLARTMKEKAAKIRKDADELEKL